MKRLIGIFVLFLVGLTWNSHLSVSAHHNDSHSIVTNKEEQSLNLAENSKSAILIERDTGNVMFDKNSNEQLPPASMTKTMTLLLIMEALDSGQITLNEKIKISEKAASMGGSQIFLETGEEMIVEDLLKGIAVASGNDASVALAERIAGTEEQFVKMMNEKVADLKLKSTNFENTTGLPADNHYSTAHDMAIIAKELLKYEKITNYTSIYEDYLRKGEENEFWLVNTNKLVRFYEGVDGLKTGYTNEAKYCLTATAEKDGMRTIAVVMGADTPKNRNADTSELLDYAYANYETKPLYEKNQVITSFEWLKADQQDIDVITNDSISILYKKGTDLDQIQTDIQIKQDITLPVEKGTVVGSLQVKQNDEVINETELVIDKQIKHANIFKLFKRMFQSFYSL